MTGLIAGRCQLPCLRQWQSNLEAGAFAEFALHVYVAAVILDDAVADGEAEAGAFADLFGGEKRIVDFGEVFGGDAAAAVAEGDEHAVNLLFGG